MKSNRLITEEYMNRESASNFTTETIEYELPTKRHVICDSSMRQPLGWQCSNKKNKNWKNWIRKYKRKYGKIKYLEMLNNTEGRYKRIKDGYFIIKNLQSGQKTIKIRTIKM